MQSIANQSDSLYKARAKSFAIARLVIARIPEKTKYCKDRKVNLLFALRLPKRERTETIRELRKAVAMEVWANRSNLPKVEYKGILPYKPTTRIQDEYRAETNTTYPA